MFCDIMTPDGQPAAADPRNVLKRTLAKAADRGFTFYTHPEIEFYLLKSSKLKNGEAQPVDSAGYFDNVPGGTAHDFRRRSVRMLEDLGISVEFSHHEAGLTMADNIMTFRTVIKEVAIEQGVYASFMPKPISGQPGSGMHTHMSLFEGDTNAFFDAAGQYQLSNIGRQFVAGLLHHAPEITAVTNQFVNSYKRLWGGDEAPSYLTWGHNNRSALVRVPLYKPGKGNSARVEYRAIDSAANPYLAFSLLLAAGLKGIEEGYELPPEADGDVWALSDSERRALGYDSLPASLDAALHLSREVMPLVWQSRPEARLIIAGNEPPEAVRRLVDGARVEVPGFIADLRPLYARATVMAAPIQRGAGIRVKILEAMAAGVPVVSTTAGAEGLDVASGRELLIGDGTAGFAAALSELLWNPPLAARLLLAGRLFARRYGIDSMAAAAEAEYRGGLARKSPRGRAR